MLINTNYCNYVFHRRAPIDEGSKKVAVVLDDVTNSDGLAVDWLYNHLYWTNTDRNTIEVGAFINY